MKTICHITLIFIAFFCSSLSVCAEEITEPTSAASPAADTKTTPDTVGAADGTTNESAPGVTIINGQRMEIYLGREMRVFGDAEFHRDADFISADRIDLNTLNDELHATGNVHVKQSGNDVDGDELKLKMEDHVGEMQNPIFHMHPSVGQQGRGSAQTIFFEGPTKERLTNARYTTCGEGIDDWFVRAKELELDHYTETATATHASLEFKGMPILYTPWIDFPLNNQRKSGFMVPTFGVTTKNGIEASIPYYWNIAPDRDATLGARYMSKRGEQIQGEYRYLDPNYQGMDSVEILPDDDQNGITRYYINLGHDHNFGDGWTGNLQYERVSDGQYFNDMSTKIASTSRVNLPQQISARYDSLNWHFSTLVQQYQTLDNLSFPYQRLPQVALSGTHDYDLVTTNLYSEFVNFGRRDNAPNVVGGIPVPTGGRFTMYPSVSVPFMQSYGYVTPKLGMHYTKYDLSDTGGAFDSETRVLPIFSVDSGMYFDRDMRVVKNHYTQTLEPRVFYVYIPHRDQSRIPNFDTALSDLNLSTIFAENQFSGGDRINDANQVTVALTSRLLDQKTGAQRLSMTIGQRYYFSDSTVVLPGDTPRSSSQSDILTAVTAQLTNGWYIDTAWQYSTDSSRTIKSNIATRYQPEPGKTLNLGYRFTKDSLEQIDISAEWPLGNNWYGLGRLNYSLRNHVATALTPADVSGPIEYIAGVEYNAGCWQGRAVLQRLATSTAVSTADASYAFFFQLELNGLSNIGSNPLEVLKRSIYGYTSTDQLPVIPPTQ